MQCYRLISSQTNLLLTTISFRLGARDILIRFGRKGAWDDGPGEFYTIVKLREREGQRADLGRSLKGHL